MPTPPLSDPLADLEARQDEVLEQLDALNQRLERVLAEFTPKAGDAKSSSRP